MLIESGEDYICRFSTTDLPKWMLLPVATRQPDVSTLPHGASKGGNKHDIVAFKDGTLMIVEAKGGNPGDPKVGGALIPDGAYRAQQMTDPYLWHKLEQDAAKDPAFTQWLIDRGMWEAMRKEDPTKIGYRLIRTDTTGKIDIYGSSQEKIGDAALISPARPRVEGIDGPFGEPVLCGRPPGLRCAAAVAPTRLPIPRNQGSRL
ncbi:hypothetical protein [Nocardia sp. R7R-8]|uniref:hypothetical protein n=1 Tax=Nocardia sp. R7R-8 TaxID=3459304 RepID=UPI00403DD70D